MMELQRASSSVTLAAPPVYERRPKSHPTEAAENGPVQATEPPSYSELVTGSRPVSVRQLERETSPRPSILSRDYRKWCYLALLLFPPSGIIALVCSVNSRTSRLMGHHDDAQLWSKRTYRCILFSTVAGVLAWLIALVVVLVIVLEAIGPDT